MDIKQKENLIRIASTLCWILGALTFLILVVMLIPIMARGTLLPALPFLAVLLVVSALYGLSAWALRKFTRWAGILVLILSGLSLAMSILAIASNQRRDIIGFIVNGAIFALVILGWKVLK